MPLPGVVRSRRAVSLIQHAVASYVKCVSLRFGLLCRSSCRVSRSDAFFSESQRQNEPDDGDSFQFMTERTTFD